MTLQHKVQLSQERPGTSSGMDKVLTGKTARDGFTRKLA